MDFHLPFSLSGVPEVQKFIGRQKEMTNIREALEGDGSRRKVVLLQGLGGIGKTQLAVSFLKTYTDSYSAIVWLDGKSEDALRQSYAATAKRL
jgi:adenylylsulfate kinase-like enzyme